MTIKRIVIAVSALFAGTFAVLAQATNNVAAAAGMELPTTKTALWTAGITVVTPLIVAGISKLVPKLPKLVLPSITPLIGIGLGLGLNALQTANLSWIDMAQAGALAVFVREVFNQAVKSALIQTMLGNNPATPPSTTTPPTT